MGIGFFVLWYHSRDRGYDLLRALGSASCHITCETGGTICYGNWVLRLVITETAGTTCFGHWVVCLVISHDTGSTICSGHWLLRLVKSHTRQGLRVVTAIGLRVLWYRTRDRGYDLVRALGSASCDILHETRGYDLLRALGSASGDITHGTGGTICYEHWVLCLVISHTRKGLRFVPGIGFCLWWYHPRDRGYDLLRASGSASCDITHETRETICYGHWVVCLVISHDTGSTICYEHWVLRLVISHLRQEVRFVTGIGFCVLWYRTRDSGCDSLRALGFASCDITHETRGTILYGH